MLVITSSFACAMAFYNTAARYLFSLAREGVLPRRSPAPPRASSPVVAAMVVTGLVVRLLLGFAIYDSSTEAALLKLGTWTPLLGVLGILAVQALVSVAIIRYFLTTGRATASTGGRRWSPRSIGGLAQVGACYLLVANRGDARRRRRTCSSSRLLPVGRRSSCSSSGMAHRAPPAVPRPSVYAGIGHFEHVRPRPRRRRSPAATRRSPRDRTRTIATSPATTHPLEPLTAEEVVAAAAMLKSGRGSATRRGSSSSCCTSRRRRRAARGRRGRAAPAEAFVVLRDRERAA